MNAIWRRELQSYFVTPIGYAFAGVFLAMASVIFYLQVLVQRSGDVLTFLGTLSYLWMLLCPVLTMRLMAEERQRGTDRLLLTSPVSLPAIALGKYLAALTVLGLTAALSLLYVLVVALYGAVYPGELLAGYLGFLLQGAAFIAMDLFFSCAVRHPVTAALGAFGANLAMWLMDLLADTSPAWLAGILNFLSLYAREEPFLMGQLSFAGSGWFLTVSAAFLALTIHTLDTHRYRGG